MPRPSLANLRTEAFLDAFMRCVARYGLDGSTLDRVSEEAGVARAVLRHYLGNRDEMVDALFKHVIEKFAATTEYLFQSLPDLDPSSDAPMLRVETLLDMLFDAISHEAENAAVYQALVAASHRHQGMADALMGFVTSFERQITTELTRAFPQADPSKCAVVAAGITAVYFNHAAAMPLDPPTSWRDRQRAVADLLIASLA